MKNLAAFLLLFVVLFASSFLETPAEAVTLTVTDAGPNPSPVPSMNVPEAPQQLQSGQSQPEADKDTDTSKDTERGTRTMDMNMNMNMDDSVAFVVSSGNSEYFQVGWQSGFLDCQSTCAEYLDSSELEDRSAAQEPELQAGIDPRRRRRRQAQTDNMNDESLAVSNSEAWRFWQGYADGYYYCTNGCEQFYSEDAFLGTMPVYRDPDQDNYIGTAGFVGASQPYEAKQSSILV